jgi:serine/threonine protein kinase
MARLLSLNNLSFLRRDPWTALPIVAKPSGPTLDGFLAEYNGSIYSSLNNSASRVLPTYRPLIYQWALQLISGLEFIHSKQVIFGDMGTCHCWLSSSLSISIVGFLEAGFNPSIYGGMICPGETSKIWAFHPLAGLRGKEAEPTYQTDLFLWGCMVYRLMTGFWPGDRLGKSSRDLELMAPRKEWPALERECMGRIIHKCWNQEYQNAAEIKKAVSLFLEQEGWEIENGDDLAGFVASELFRE